MRKPYSKFVRDLTEIGLLDAIQEKALKHHVSLEDLYNGPLRAPSIVSARRDVYTWLLKNGKGLNEVARIFNRNAGGISKLVGHVSGNNTGGGRSRRAKPSKAAARAS